LIGALVGFLVSVFGLIQASGKPEDSYCIFFCLPSLLEAIQKRYGGKFGDLPAASNGLNVYGSVECVT
tara:strand:+ start:184 stop:387 length:204 start_codon:yes stop_codon:yes gene_type:complete